MGADFVFLDLADFPDFLGVGISLV
jgi:hypothetical protein